MTDSTDTLPILTVNTRHSRYVIDQNTGTYTRTRVHEDANDLSYGGVADAVPHEYRDFVLPGVDESMLIVHTDGSWVRSTRVVDIDHGA